MAKNKNRRPKRPTRDGPARTADGKKPRKDRAAPTARPRKGRLTGRRKWALRLALAVLGPVLALAILEGVLRLAGYGYPTGFFAKVEGQDAYVVNDKFGWRFFPRAIAREAMPFRLPAEKPPDTYRIFVLGGSAAQGVPAEAFSFSRILEVMLRQRFAGARFEVINTGMVAINSHVVVPIARECADHDPDLFVVYLGNNEVVGPYGAGTVLRSFSPNLTLIRAGIRIRTTRVGQMLERLVTALSGRGQTFQEWKGMEMFARNAVTAGDPRLQDTYRHFRDNLTDIATAGTDAGAKALLCTVATNLRDCPPFASRHRGDLAAPQQRQWEQLYKQGSDLQESGRHADAVGAFEEAARIDDRYAELSYRLGQCRLGLSEYDKAGAAFIRARDLDALRFRCDTRLNEIIREVAAQQSGRGVGLVDAAAAVGSDPLSPHGIPGRDLIFEHVHLTFAGNYALARAVFGEVVGLLPERIRRLAAPDVSAPTLAECEQALVLTDYARYRMIERILGMVRYPPFTEQLGHEAELEAYQRELARLAAGLTPNALAAACEAYRRALEQAPDDLFLRNDYALLLHRRKDYAAAEREFRRLLERIPRDAGWTA
ncbi:MAG TPA: tetratricopeptide repeat protein, partial [Phycisphaerae bacterium]|nr:tetratricopeptide repeat protein [Phycisphaerae bacterium]